MNLIKLGSNETMSSLDFLNGIINPVRLSHGESEVRPADFHNRVNDEIDEKLNYESFVVGKTGHKTYFTHLTMKQMMRVGMRESKAVRSNVADILDGMNADKAPQLPQSFSEALQLAVDQAKQLELAAPKVKYFDTVAERETLINATQVGQKVKLSAKRLNSHLSDFDAYNNSVKRGRAFKQWFVDKGYGIMRQTELGYPQPLFTPQGEQWIIEQLSVNSIV